MINNDVIFVSFVGEILRNAVHWRNRKYPERYKWHPKRGATRIASEKL